MSAAILIRHRWEIAAAAVGVAVSLWLLPHPAAGFAAALAALAVYVAAVDLERLVIPDVANAAMFVLGLALALVEAEPDGRWWALGDALLRAAVLGGMFLLLRFGYSRATGVIGLGLGDVKLAAAGAPFLAWATLPIAVVLAATAAIFAIVTRAALRRERLDRKLELPFGAFLAPAIWLAFVLERTGFLMF